MALQEFSKTFCNVLMVPQSPILPAIFVLDWNEALLLLSAGISALLPLAPENGSSV